MNPITRARQAAERRAHIESLVPSAAVLAERAAMLQVREDALAAEAERRRELREEPIRRVVGILRDRLGSDLPAFARELGRVDLKEVIAFLADAVAQDDAAQRAAADQVNRAADRAANVELSAKREARKSVQKRQAELAAGVL